MARTYNDDKVNYVAEAIARSQGKFATRRNEFVAHAKAARLAGIDTVELSRHHQAQVAGRAGGPVEVRIVNHVRYAVSRQLHVELRMAQAETPGGLESGKRIFRKVFRIAAVCDDFGKVGPGGGWCQYRSAGFAGL